MQKENATILHDMPPYNQVYHGDFLSNTLPDKSVQLLIADPPYFEVKGGFDFIWASFADYLKDVERWAVECKRLLADNGTLFWWGHAKKIAYSQVILDKYFNLENSIAVEFNRQTKKGVEAFRCFAPVSERVLMYSNEVNITGLQEIYSNPDCFQSIKAYMRSERDKLMASKGFTTISKFNDFINEWTNTSSVVSRHYFADSQYSFPTKEIYEVMQKTGFWRREYEDLRREYEDLRRPFNNFMRLFDIMKFDQEAYITGQYSHPTQKPQTLTRTLILTCSRPNDLVFVPFAGSGTECAMAAKEGRRFIGFDVEEKYVTMANERAQKVLAQPAMF
jgi:site-specific DNA-methyltransferase (adenine-specific)